MHTIQGTLRRFVMENTAHGVRVSYILEGNPTIYKGTFPSDDNKALHLLARSGPGDDVEIVTDDEGQFCEVNWKNLTYKMELKLKQPKVGDFDGLMYADPDETLVFAKKVYSRYN